MRKLLCTGLFVLAMTVPPAAAQTVLFDGLTNGQGDVTALLAPAVITGNSYSLFGRLDYGATDRVNLFALGGGTFNGGNAGFGGAGWSANLYQQTARFPVNLGFFNSWVFPARTAGPDALITVAPVFSHSFDRSLGGRVTPYAGVSATLAIGATGTLVNGVIGVKVTELTSKWDFIAELQPGEQNQFALGFVFRF